MLRKGIIAALCFCSYGLGFTQDEGVLVSSGSDVFEFTLEQLLNTEVTTVTRDAEKASEAPATIHVITKEQILLRGYNSLDELLMDIPEIEVHGKSDAENYNTVAFRGIVGNQKFMVMLDGQRINAPSGSPHAIAQNYSIAQAERVEVVLGPASALYGVDAFTGVINIITRKGEDISGGALNTSYGTYNTTNNSFVAGHQFQDFSFNVNCSYFYSDEPPMYELYEDEFAWYNDQYSQNGTMQISQFDTNSVSTGDLRAWDMSNTAYNINASLKFKGMSVGFYQNCHEHSSATSYRPELAIYSSDAIIQSRLSAIYGTYEAELSEKWSSNTQFLYSSYQMGSKSKFINTFTNYADGFKYSTETSFLFTEQLNYKINDNSSLIFGGQFQDITALPKSGDLPFAFDETLPADAQNIYYLGTNVEDSLGNDLSINQDFYTVKYQNIGGFLQYKLDFKEWAKLTLGTRADYNTRYGSSFSPRLGLVLTPVEKLKVKLLYGQAFLAPSPYVSYQHYGSFIPVTENGNVKGFQSFFWHLPNPDLNPERLSTYELGVDYKITDEIRLFVNGYYNQITDLIIMGGVPNMEFQGVNVGFVELPENKGTASTYGGTARISSLHELRGDLKLNVNLSYSYLDGDIDGEKLSYVTYNFIKSNIDVYHKRLLVGLGTHYRMANNSEYENIIIMNLNVNYLLLEKDKLNLHLFTTIRNVLDQRYYTIPQGEEGIEFVASPQDPIRVQAGLRMVLK
ncbi:MAG: TonB-dependent receptor [Cytophagales bacterium]|nr:TonB-dependent receptor [Cytophagales bacterium]